MDIGATGRQSDGGIFACSEIGKRLNSAQLNIPPFLRITEDRPQMPHVLVGDEAFPLVINLLQPYPRSLALGIEELVFNYRLSRARLTIENTFGILASKWRIFSRSIIAKLENAENIIKATVCLHNFIMKKNSSYFMPNLVDQEKPNKTVTPGTWRQDASILKPIGRLGNNNYMGTTKAIRDTFRDYFNEEGSV
ncbi:hypothetical protein NQ314_011630 [Rhamnusium bicolor]|uniref:DDE Tnp4 domain-containing protein n=1 Tax=Rhamnusium bicolor TaxID=1586634 RepID=A0AAV8XHC6_9CUCU|nr:hypothetical protein NQ314_011630 [Rhamnusium bicolor]